MYLAKQYSIKAIATYDSKSIRSWARRAVLQAGTYRPNWIKYVLARILVISLPMTSCNLKLVNIQKSARNHTWDLHAMIAEHTSHDNPDLSEENLDDLVRCPANRKSRFDLEEYDAAAQQRQHCNLFLHSTGVNRDLVEPPDKLRSATSTDPYRPPAQQAPAITQQPEDLAAGLYMRRRHIYGRR